MQQRPQVMTESNMLSATRRAQHRVQEWIDLAHAASTDSRREERLAHLECKACFYSTGIGGAAMTHRACMSCGRDELYASTNTDALCAPCAKAGELCKHCGGDSEMRTRRRFWPKAYSAEADPMGDPPRDAPGNT